MNGGPSRKRPRERRDFSETYSDTFDGCKPTILFDLNGVLLQSRVFSEEKVKGDIPVFPRPGLRHLASLYPYFRVGLYTSARLPSVQPRALRIWEHLDPHKAVQTFIRQNRVPVRRGDLSVPGSLFSVVLDRGFCRPDPNWRSWPGGKPHDSMKPLDAHGFDPARTVLVDDSLRKILPHEHANALILPSYTVAANPELASEPDDVLLPMREPKGGEDPFAVPRQVPVLRAVVALLIAHVSGTAGDVRPGLERVRQDLAQALETQQLPQALRHLAEAPEEAGPRELPLLFNEPPPQPPYGAPRTLPPRNTATPRPPHLPPHPPSSADVA